MSYLELTIVRLELSSNLLVPHAFAFRILVSFVSHVTIFWQRQRGANAFIEDCSEKFHKII